MEKVKLSTLKKNDVVLVDGYSTVDTVEDVLNDLDFYRDKKIYTTTAICASFDAKEILEAAIEDQQCNVMYEDWDDSIRGDITKEDIEELQVIFDRILARNPASNLAYEPKELIEIDIIRS